MATPAQIAANRANAQRSTGPRTPEGKSASRFNALKHGLDAASVVIPGEDPAAYDALAADYQRQFQPQSALEQFHVDTLIRSDWQRRRLQRSEAKLYRALLAEGTDPEDVDVALLRDSPNAKLLRKVFAQIASLERAFNRALSELRRMEKAAEKAHAAEFEAYLDVLCTPPDLSRISPNKPNLATKPAPAAVPDNPALRL